MAWEESCTPLRSLHFPGNALCSSPLLAPWEPFDNGHRAVEVHLLSRRTQFCGG